MRHFKKLLLLAPISVFAATLGGPLAGYATFANGTELRAILGTPGAYQYSAPLPLPEGATRVHPAPGRDFALVERATAADFPETPPGIVTYRDGAIDTFAPMPGAIAAPDWVVYSNEGGAVVLYSETGHRIQAWSGLPGSPQVVLDRADALGAPAVTAAVSEDGTTVLAASRNAIYLIPDAGTARLALSGSVVASVAMLRNGRDAVVADRGAGVIQLLHDVSSGVDPQVLASGLEDIGAIYPSSDGGSLYAALPTVQAIAAVDLGSGAVITFASGVAAHNLQRLRSRDTFLISSSPRQPAWVFFRDEAAPGDAGVRSGRSVFIPALVRSEEEQQ